MNIENWFTYLIAYTVISLMPGPSVAMVLAQSLSRGLKAAMYCILGDLLGGIVVISVSFAGLGVILATSSQLFFIFKWAGVIYLAYLGLSQIISAARKIKPEEISEVVPEYKWASLRAGFLTGTLNPKEIMFYLAFLAQFIDRSHAVPPQFLLLMFTSIMVAALVLGAYAVMAVHLKKSIQSSVARKRMDYFSGSFLLGGSAFLATR